MMIHSSRPYSGAQDLQSMIDLLVTVRPADRITDYPSMVDLHEALALTHVQDHTRLWFDAHDLVGFAFVDAYNNLWFEFDQQAAHPGIGSKIIAWGVARIRRVTKETGASCTLGTNCRDDDSERIALLERHGFVRQETRTLQMVRPLDQTIPMPQVPAGFGVRHVVDECEAQALVALHRAAFGTENMTIQERLAMMQVPEYDSELDLLAIAPDGRFAAYCMCSISQKENERTGRREGYTDPVATHPDFQRRGLARALLLTGFHKLKQRGMDTAVLHTSSANVAMQRAAQAVGLRVQSTKLWFSKSPAHNTTECEGNVQNA
jgi:GNAT superfamily N-acetyltransferase